MLLKNKKTGEIGNLKPYEADGRIWVWIDDMSKPEYRYNSLAELNADWEDAPEEPKEWWYIDIHGPHKVNSNDEYYQQVKAASKEIGNYFSSREEAEKAVEELRAFKRLKDKGFRFKKWESYEETSGVSFPDRHIITSYTAIFDFNKPCKKYEIKDEVKEDLDLLFSQEVKND